MPTSEPAPIKLEIAVFQNGTRRVIARGLQYDFIGEGDDEREAIENLTLAVHAEFAFAEEEHRQPFDGLPSPPLGFAWWNEQRIASRWIEVTRPA